MHLPLVDTASSIAQIVLINFVLSGDNALVIAMAARHLPPRQRRAAMLWGSGLAIVLRLGLTLIVSYVLLVPGLRFLGAVLLLWIACKLLQEGTPIDGQEGPTVSRLRTAVFRIAMADLIMSLDNVLAVAGISRSDPFQLAVGLVLSITMILACSNLILVVMDRYRWIAYAGAGVLALTAAGMVSHDLNVVAMMSTAERVRWHVPGWVDWSLRGGVTGACLTSGLWWPKRPGAVEPA